MLWSHSPFGEGKRWYSLCPLKWPVNIYWGLPFFALANVLVFPIMTSFLDVINRYFQMYFITKMQQIFVGPVRAKAEQGQNVERNTVSGA